MNYSPDYPMRRRNQDCGCNRSSMPDFRPSAPRNRSRNECGCNNSEPDGIRPLPPPPMPQPACPDTCAVGMAYVPWQVWRDLYNLEEALPIGTIFRELDYPWEVGKCARCR